MPSTTVYLPDDLFLRIDRSVNEKGVIRDRKNRIGGGL